MGECGCNLDVTRCKAHADDVIAVLTTQDRDLIVSALEFASTYALQPDLAADRLARTLAATPTEAERAGVSSA